MYKVLSIGFDKGILIPTSESFVRQLTYSSWLKNLTLIILKANTNTSLQKNSLKVVPTQNIFDALKQGIAENRHTQFDLITTSDPFFCGLVGVFLKLALNRPLCVQIHTEIFNNRYFRTETLYSFFLFVLGHFVMKFADTARSRNRRIKTDLEIRFPHLKGKVLFVGAPIEDFFLVPVSNRKRDSNLILSVGRLVKQKNFSLLINAVASIKKDFPNLRLTIMGDGPLKSTLQNQIASLGLSGSVSLIPYDAGQSLRLLDKASLFTLPSNHEGWGLVCLQALARETPVVMTRTGCADEIVINQRTGLVVPLNNEVALAQAITTVLKAPEKYVSLARTGRQLVLKDVDLAKIRRDLISLYQLTVKSRKSQPKDRVLS